MSAGSDHAIQGASEHVFARAQGAQTRAELRLADAIADFFLDDDARLDDRTRLALAHVLGGIVAAIEADIRHHAARLLAGNGDSGRAESILRSGGVLARLTRVGLLRDRDLMDELIARVRHDLIAEALPTAIAGPDEASLLVRLAGVPDSVVASAAAALLAAEARRRSAAETTVMRSELPAELHHRLVWWIAAAICVVAPVDCRHIDVDRAVVGAATRALGAHDEGDRTEALAPRLAAAIDARADEISPLLVEAIGDRQLTLFVAVLAHAVGIAFDQARRLVLDREGERLWLALRSIDLDRVAIAKIALALSDADPARDIEAFADTLDAIVAVPVDAARAVLAPLALDRDFRAALRLVGRSSS